jgi:transposase-like protein
LECEALGREVVVGGMHDSPIPWPYRYQQGPHSLILCGDLVRAVQAESEKAVAHHWGVSPSTVYLWRKALGVGKWTEGTTRLILGAIERGREASRSAESRAKMSKARAGKPLSSKLRAAALEAARRPMSDDWKRTMSQRMK